MFGVPIGRLWKIKDPGAGVGEFYVEAIAVPGCIEARDLQL
jgi:hypothetical protein